MNSKILVKAGVTVLAAAMLFTACESSSGRSDRRRRDRDDDSSPRFTRASAEASETTETASVTPTPPVENGVPAQTTASIPDVSFEYASYYLDVISQYEDQITALEDEYRSTRFPSINYYDINGDGIEELMFKYQSEPYCANLAIFHYNPDTGEVEEWFNAYVEDNLGSWGLSSDVVYLNDGDLLILNFMGSGGSYYQTMDEYALTEDGYSLCNSWGLEEFIDDNDHAESGHYTVITGDATFNGGTVPAQDFYDAQEYYINRISSPVMPYSSRLYYDDHTVLDIYDRDWCGIPGVIFNLANYMYLEDFLAYAGA